MFPLLIALAANTITTTPAQIAAVSPTPTPNDILKQVQEKVQEKLKQFTAPSSSKKGFIGKIITVSGNSLAIDYQNNTKTFSLSDTTVYVNAKGTKIKKDSLTIGQDALILANLDPSTNSFEAKRVVLSSLDSLTNPHLVVVGKIVDISKTTPIFSLIPTRNKNTQYQIKTDAKTVIATSDDQSLKAADLKSGQKIITVLIPDPKLSKTYYAQKIINLDYVQSNPSPTVKP